MRKKEMEGAAHLFEALSGVDQELLERTEKDEEGAHSGALHREPDAAHKGHGAARKEHGAARKEHGAGENSEAEGREESRKKRLHRIKTGEKMLAAAACFAAACVGLWAAGKVSFDAGSTSEMMKGAGQKAAVAEEAGFSEASGLSEGAVPEAAAAAEVAEDAVPAAAAEVQGDAGQGAAAELPESAEKAAEQEPAQAGLQEEELWEGTADKIVLLPEAIQAGQDLLRLSEQEARQVQLLGNYVPEQLPKGYAFEEAYCSEGGQRLFVSFAKGMDYIEMCICRDSGEHIAFTDTDKTEAYDVHLYQVPYADTVPEEYRETFERPVFKSSDLCLEVVEARFESYEDAGDTYSPKGKFAVYYEEAQVLVEFRGCGEAESIWKLFEELGK